MDSIRGTLPFALIAWVAGIFALYQMNEWDKELKVDLQAISAGDCTKHDYELTKKYIQKGTHSDDMDGHWIVLSGPTEESIGLPFDEYELAYVGQRLEGYHVNGRVRFLEYHKRAPNAKWIMFGFCFILGSLPLGFVGIGHFYNQYREVNQ